jgi:hypothetical protein
VIPSGRQSASASCQSSVGDVTPGKLIKAANVLAGRLASETGIGNFVVFRYTNASFCFQSLAVLRHTIIQSRLIEQLHVT